MKIKLLIIVSILTVLIIIGSSVMIYNTVRITNVFEGEAVFKYGGSNEINSISKQDIDNIIKIFNGKFTYKDNPSCGFSEDISVKLNNDQIFCFARDTCPIIYWKNKDRYFKISKSQKTELYEILNKYGFYFPCV